MIFLSQIPALVRVALVFAIVLIGIRKNLSLGTALLIGSLAMSLMFGFGPRQTMQSMLSSIFDLETVTVAMIVGLILILSSSMEKAGQMQRLLKSFRGLVSNPRLNLTIFPALIGLLPMPGGAVFSAPMVKELAADTNLSNDRLSFVNYWFRHIWEYWWPLYPGILLAAIMAEVNLAVLVSVGVPITLVAVLLGQGNIKGLHSTEDSPRVDHRPPLRPFIRELMPILIAIIPGLSLGILLSRMVPALLAAKESALIISLCAAVAWIWRVNRFSREDMAGIMANRHVLKMVYMVIAILIFKGILTDSHAVAAISDELMRLKIPLVLVMLAVPFLVGMLTGLTVAFVASAFPILIPMIHSMGEARFMVAYVMLALVSGFAGVLLSPVHLCLLLSNEYFHTSQMSVYKLLWIPCTGLILAGVGYFWILHYVSAWI
jgi:integral membrane protein (TIGR00529 family)